MVINTIHFHFGVVAEKSR